jgi:hypothetical protein
MDGRDLRIRPRGGELPLLSADFHDFDLFSREVLVHADRPAWKRFRFDAASQPGGHLTFIGDFHSEADVELSRDMDIRRV